MSLIFTKLRIGINIYTAAFKEERMLDMKIVLNGEILSKLNFTSYAIFHKVNLIVGSIRIEPAQLDILFLNVCIAYGYGISRSL